MIDLNKAKERMKQLQRSRKDFDLLSYNIQQGDNVIRFILKPGYTWPFINARMYYNIQRQFFLSPEYESKEHEPQPDPILEELNELMKSENPEDRAFAKQHFPSKRVFGLGVVRSQEDKGAVWINFPQKVERDIMEYLFNIEYIDMQKALYEEKNLEHPGQILDITNHEFGVDFLINKNMKTLNGYPEYTVRPLKLTNPFSKLANTQEKIDEFYEGIPEFDEAYTHLTYDEIKLAWDRYLEGTNSEDEVTEEPIKEESDMANQVNQALSRFKKLQKS